MEALLSDAGTIGGYDNNLGNNNLACLLVGKVLDCYSATDMGKDKGAKPVHANKIYHCTISMPETSHKDQDHEQQPETRGSVPTTAELLATIQGFHVALEDKLYSMAIEMDHLEMDLRNEAYRTTTVKDDVDALKQEVRMLRATVEGMKCSATHMEEQLEDSEGCT
ncbi:hypothetical protein NDU88_008238 [Pleurodeles waltl]|uniref:Uncharacterized protein n=1 Tax=Pleurodeles waltl TaxID=8319 RepID=A0AAV7RXE2_PLEWA|nr:hypothetical protein NDU88_008238 [Pleurodeles waltl]